MLNHPKEYVPKLVIVSSRNVKECGPCLHVRIVLSGSLLVEGMVKNRDHVCGSKVVEIGRFGNSGMCCRNREGVGRRGGKSKKDIEESHRKKSRKGAH